MKPALFAAVFVLAIGLVARAYYPIECNDEHAAFDYSDADAIIIARCIKVERRIDAPAKQKLKCFYYIATMKVGRVTKGSLKVGDEFEMAEGNYLMPDDDNVTPTYVAQCGTHARAGLVPGGVFLLFIKQREPKIWSPVSCHYSIHEIVNIGNNDVLQLGVNESPGPRQLKDTKTPVPLDDFLKRKENDAIEAKKKKGAVRPLEDK